MTYWEADKLCDEMGGHLTRVNSNDMKKLLYSNSVEIDADDKLREFSWIEYTDRYHEPMWLDSEMNDEKTETCAIINFSSMGVSNNERCTERIWFGKASSTL